MSVCPSVRTSIRPQSVFDFHKVWRVMHDGMQYDPIQGQGHEPLNVGNPFIFQSYLRHLEWELATYHLFLKLRHNI